MSPKPLQILLIAFPIFLFGWLAWQYLVPTGTAVIVQPAGAASAIFDPIRPDQRVIRQGNDVVIDGDPVYTFIHPWRPFDSVQLDIAFHDDGVPIVEAGGLTKTNPETYALEPLENNLIDDSTWSRLDQNGQVLLQRTPTYASIADFWKHLPAGNRIAFYQNPGLLPDGTRRLLPSLNLDQSKIDFVIAEYQTPVQTDGWTVATMQLDPSLLLMQNGAWKVAISAPGANPGGPTVTIHSITATFHLSNVLPSFLRRG